MKEAGKSKVYILGESDSSDVITPDNVKYTGEMMAVCAVKNFIRNGVRLDTLYRSMLRDINRTNRMNHNSQDVFSNGYDFCQEAICFLCGHFGKDLNDVLWIDKKGKEITVKKAVLRLVSREIARYITNNRRAVNYDDMHEQEAPFELEIDCEADYETVEKIMDMLGLSDRQKEALRCRMSGMSYPETGRMLSINQSSAYEIIARIRKLYIAMFSEPRFRQLRVL